MSLNTCREMSGTSLLSDVTPIVMVLTAVLSLHADQMLGAHIVLRQTAVKRYLGFPITTPKPGSNPTLTAVQPLGHAAGGKPIQTFAQRPTVKPKDRKR